MGKATLEDLTEAALKFRDARHWKQFHSFKDLALTLCLEAAEVLEHAQWKNGKELEEHLKNQRGKIADELADVLHVILLLAEQEGIDLAAAFKDKLARNAKKYPVHKAKGSAKKYTEL